MRKKFLLFLITVAFSTAHAQTYFITNGSSNNWNTLSNWDYFNGISLGAASNLPGMNDSVVIAHNLFSYGDTVRVTSLTITASFTSYQPIIINSGSGNGIAVMTGASIKHFNGMQHMNPSSTLFVSISAGGLFDVAGGIDSTVVVNNYGHISYNYGGSLQQDGIINNYNLLSWTSSQGTYSQFKRGIINNYDSLVLKPSGSSHVYFQDQIITNKVGGKMIVGGTSSFVYLQDGFYTIADTATLINDGEIFCDSIFRWVLGCNTVNNGTINVGLGSEAYYVNNRNHYLAVGSNITGYGKVSLYGNKFCTGVSGQADISVDTVLLGFGTVYGPRTLAITSKKFVFDGDLASNGIIQNQSNSYCEIGGATVKSIAGLFINYGKLVYSSTNISGGGQINNQDTIIFNSTNGSGYVVIGDIVINNGKVCIFDCGSTEQYKQTGISAQFINALTGKVFIKNNSDVDFDNGFFDATGPIYIEAGSKLRLLNNVVATFKCDTIFSDGSIACFGNGLAKFTRLNGTQYISNWNTNNATTITKIEVANNSNVELLAHVNCSNLSLASGKLILNKSILTIDDAANISGFDSSKYIVTNDTGFLNSRTYYFNNSYAPIGTATKYAPIKLINQTGVAPFYENFAYRVQDSVYTAYTNDLPSGGTLYKKAINATYYVRNCDINGVTINPANSSLQVKVEPGYSLADTLDDFDVNNIRVSHYINGAWTYNPVGGTFYDATLKANRTDAINFFSSLSPFAISTGPLVNCNNTSYTIDSLKDNTCPNDSNGVFRIASANAVAPFTYTGLPSYILQSGNLFTKAPNDIYTITISDANACTGIVTATIASIGTLPTAPAITPNSTSICAGSDDEFTATTTEANSIIIWYNSNGIAVDTGSSFIVQSTAATYTARVQNTFGCKSAISTATVVEIALPTLTNLIVPNTLCADNTAYSLYANSNATVNWFNSTNTLLGSGDTILVDPSLSTKYIVQAIDSASTCAKLDSVQLSFHPAINIAVAAPTSGVCLNSQDSIVITTNASNALFYNDSLGSSVIANTKKLVLTLSNDSIFYIQAYDSITKCASSNILPVSIAVKQLPVISNAVLNDSVCVGQLATLSAGSLGNITPGLIVLDTVPQFLDTLNSALSFVSNMAPLIIPTDSSIYFSYFPNAPSILVNSPGTYDYKIPVTQSGILVAPWTAYVDAFFTNAKETFSIDGIVVTNNGTGAVTGPTIRSGIFAKHYYKGDTIVVQASIIKNSLAAYFFLNKITFLLDSVPKLSWYNASNQLLGNNAQYQIVPTGNTVGTLVVTNDINGCSITLPTSIVVNPIPTLSNLVPGDTICLSNASHTFTATSASTINWYKSGTLLGVGDSVTITPTSAGIFDVQVIDSITGCADTQSTSLGYYPPINVFTAGPIYAVCSGTTDSITVVSNSNSVLFYNNSNRDSIIHTGKTLPFTLFRDTVFYFEAYDTITQCREGIVYPKPYDVAEIPKLMAISPTTRGCENSNVVLSAVSYDSLNYDASMNFVDRLDPFDATYNVFNTDACTATKLNNDSILNIQYIPSFTGEWFFSITTGRAGKLTFDVSYDVDSSNIVTLNFFDDFNNASFFNYLPGFSSGFLSGVSGTVSCSFQLNSNLPVLYVYGVSGQINTSVANLSISNIKFTPDTLFNYISWYNAPMGTLLHFGNYLNTSTNTATYYTQITNPRTGCKSDYDSVTVNFVKQPQISVSVPSPICIGTTAIVSVDTGVLFNSNIGNNQIAFIVDSTNTQFIVSDSVDGCVFADTAIVIGIDNFGAISLTDSGNVNSIAGNDSAIRFQDTLWQTYKDINCNDICSIQPINKMDSVQANVYVASTTPLYNNQPYVKRYWQITPSTQSPAQVILYCTQADFDDYNMNKGSFKPLPLGSGDTSGLNNVRITKVEGGVIGVGNQLSVITPDSMVWDSNYNRWAIHITVSSFSYFYIHGVNLNNTPLNIGAITLEGKSTVLGNDLQWNQLSVATVARYIVYHGADKNNLTTIADVMPNNISNLYFEHKTIVQGNNYYRVAAILLDGSEVRSNIINLVHQDNTGTFSIYPNPAASSTVLSYNAPQSMQARIKILDEQGRKIKHVEVPFVKGGNTVQLDLLGLSSGVYQVQVFTNKGLVGTKQLVIVQ
jgi:hypothetical protein